MRFRILFIMLMTVNSGAGNGLGQAKEGRPQEPLVKDSQQTSIRLATSTTLPNPVEVQDQELKPITFDLLEGPASKRPDFSGSPISPRWLDNKHFLIVEEGRLQKVNALTGDAEPFHDRDTLAEALAKQPTIDERAARNLARRTSFVMDPEHKGALLSHQGDLYYATFDGSKAVRLTSHPGQEELTEFSPDGRFVAFVRDNDLHVVDLETQTERALTTGGTELVRNGKAVWVYFEELFGRSWKAYWWSPDSNSIAYLQLDDTPLEPHTVLDDIGPRRVVEETPYPWAGDPNPRVKLGIVSASGGAPRYADLSSYLDGSFLVSHVGWFPDSEAAYCYVQNRTQTWLDVLRLSPANGNARKLFRETTEAWVESPGDPQFLLDGSFLWLSERDGWKHLYQYKADGTLKGQITRGEWEVRDVHFVDNDKNCLYVSGTKNSPIAQNLYRISLEGDEVERLTKQEGDHSISMAPDGKHYVDRWSNIETPTKVALYQSNGDCVRMLDENPVTALKEYRFGPRELIQIETKDGFLLEGELILPPDLDDSKRYPVWFTTYGGPHTPTVSNSWAGGRVWDQALAQEGFIVFRVDPRPASGKGAVSAWTAYKRLGHQELDDIKEAIEWLKEKPYVDGKRIGMTGHSYGGYMTAFALTHCDLFACGIAGAPVTDWHNYDTIYTERFMLTPQENPEGYAASSVIEAAGNLHGRLLIVHGAKDDNVSLRNTYQLVQKLQAARKDFELMIYPEARHGIPNPHYNQLRLDFIRRTLNTSVIFDND